MSIAQSTAGVNQTPISTNIIGLADNAMASVISSINTPLSHSKSSSHTSYDSPDGRLQQADSRPARRKGQPAASGFTIRAAQGLLKRTSTDESQAFRAAAAPAASSRAFPPKYGVRAYQDAVASPAAGGGLEQHADRSTPAGFGSNSLRSKLASDRAGSCDKGDRAGSCDMTFCYFADPKTHTHHTLSHPNTAAPKRRRQRLTAFATCCMIRGRTKTLAQSDRLQGRRRQARTRREICSRRA